MHTLIRLLATSLVAILMLAQPAVVSAQRTTADPAEALIKSARQASKAEEAEDFYLRVALSHPTSPYAAESLLRLGQARLAAGDAKQATVYLQRLMADYPRSEYRPLGALWLARTQVAIGRSQVACSTLTNALQLSSVDTETETLLRADQTTVCDAAEKAPAVAVPQPERVYPETTRTAPPVTAPSPTTSAMGRYTIQVAAFRERSGAQTVARQLERAGFTAVRLVKVPGNELIRVRIGNFESSSAAAATVSRLRTAGFSSVVVSDAQRENPVQ